MAIAVAFLMTAVSVGYKVVWVLPRGPPQRLSSSSASSIFVLKTGVNFKAGEPRIVS